MIIPKKFKALVVSHKKSHHLEDLIMEQVTGFVKTLPPLPPGWVYDFIPGEPKYNPETNTWETTMEAKPRQKYSIEED